MAQFKKAVITQKGLALIQKTQMQSIKLEFSKIVTGSGEYSEDEELGDLENLKEKKQEFPISSITVIDIKTVKLVSVLSNADLKEPYYVGEIGIFANDPDEGEILYSLAVAYPGKADYLPAYDGFAPITIGLDTYQKVSSSENVTIRADTGAYAAAKDLEELKKRLDLLEKRNNILIGPESTEIRPGETLFVIEEIPKFEEAAFTNMEFGTAQPDDVENWGETYRNVNAQESKVQARYGPLEGKLTVGDQPDHDTVFFANINPNSQKERND